MASTNPLVNLAASFDGFVARRKEHRLVARLSRMPVHIVRDMGFDPDKVASELEGTWDDISLVRR